ncbi:MAG TPA: radical SAM protein [Bryobacteraceae bacterium]|nr:radical SAM protein [Bryobacteraceae bacterium]HOQ46903.1 radical SAM protein [Bryobacteraceae bacterium]HPQ15548.1 radical SAM protein [Bryobacteraceae bacterium]HPU73028.1 radical SAM protein [Bryobacteraceae bacterium]
MPNWDHRLRRRARAIHRRMREIEMIVRGLVSTSHPILAHLIPIRRCNLSCKYCNEYDHVSPPVPVETLRRRVDRLAELGTSIVTISGGEPLLHPEVEEVIARIRRRGMIAGLITNGYLLTAERIQRLNRAGLDHMQISIDNVQPDGVSVKSLKVLDRKLKLLAEHALFHVNINSVVGAGMPRPQDALVVARRAVELGFSSTVGLCHDPKQPLKALSEEERRVFLEAKKLGKRSYARINRFQDNIAEGKLSYWRCRAGARYLYVCEDGLVHYCSQRRGFPAKPLEEYTRADMRRAFVLEKGCAPTCTISCVHQVSYIDFWRAPQKPLTARKPGAAGLVRPSAPPAPELVQIASPLSQPTDAS